MGKSVTQRKRKSRWAKAPCFEANFWPRARRNCPAAPRSSRSRGESLFPTLFVEDSEKDGAPAALSFPTLSPTEGDKGGAPAGRELSVVGCRLSDPTESHPFASRKDGAPAALSFPTLSPTEGDKGGAPTGRELSVVSCRLSAFAPATRTSRSSGLGLAMSRILATASGKDFSRRLMSSKSFASLRS